MRNIFRRVMAVFTGRGNDLSDVSTDDLLRLQDRYQARGLTACLASVNAVLARR